MIYLICSGLFLLGLILGLKIHDWKKPNDWQVIKVFTGEWEIKRPVYAEDEIVKYHEYTEKCNILVQYSMFRSRYRLTYEGYNPKGHHIYAQALNFIAEQSHD